MDVKIATVVDFIIDEGVEEKAGNEERFCIFKKNTLRKGVSYIHTLWSLSSSETYEN